MDSEAQGASREKVRTESERLERRRESRRRYRERHADELREQSRQWKAAHPEKVKEYGVRYRAAHLEQIRTSNRESARVKRAADRKSVASAKRRREKGRERYAADPKAHREYQRKRRAAQRAADPEGYRKAKKQRTKRWRDSHRDEQNAKLRAKHRDNPEVKRAAAERYYAEHGDEVRERRRAYYWANREKQLETQRRWRAREKRRREAGLPPRRLHRVTAAERSANAKEAEEFFSRARTREEVKQMRRGPRTSAVELAQWNRASMRARLASAISADSEAVKPVAASEGRRESENLTARRLKAKVAAAEEERMDAIAREINDRLRKTPRRAQVHRPGYAPTPAPPTTSEGLSL